MNTHIEDDHPAGMPGELARITWRTALCDRVVPSVDSLDESGTCPP